MKPTNSAPARPAHLEGLERYEPGKPIEEVQRESGIRRVVKLASNENPLGPSPAALAAAHTALAQAHRYPDGPATALRKSLSLKHGVEPTQIAIGNGATEVMGLLVRAFLGPEHNAVVADRAFSRFRQAVGARNRRARLVPMRDSTHDLEAMAAAADGETRLLYVANPNNPTGTWNRRQELEALVARMPPEALVVLDEAYFEYADDPEYPDGTRYLKQGAPIVVLRTFSKVYGLAGLRVGYCVAAPEVVDAIDTVREPFNANAIGQAAAVAALEDPGHVRRTLDLNRMEKARMEAALTERGLAFLPSLGNFLCVQLGRTAAEVYRRLLGKGVIVRPLVAYGMPESLRISIGTPDENTNLLEALDAVLTAVRA
jgi:histidinol-phosphate aminotransferase